MKKRIYIVTALLVSALCVGCGNKKTESETENKTSQTENQTDTATPEDKDLELQSITEADYTYDYTDDIKTDVDYVVSNSQSIQDELKNIDKITQKYSLLAESAQTQGEMNVASQWLYAIWDTELNNLWSRFSSSADSETKERVLTEQRNWIAMKDDITSRYIGLPEENGSMYPLLKNSFLEEITMNRSYFLADELAKVKGEAFTMPEASEKYGVFVDNYGTDSVHSSLITRQATDGNDTADIFIFRRGGTQGTFIDNGNGELAFTADDGNIKGIIKINGWDGATFEVTETTGVSPFDVGEKFEFPFIF